MKLATACVSAGLALMTITADAQVLAPSKFGPLPSLSAVSDFDAPYSAVPPESPPNYAGPTLLPPEAIFGILRENGFAPLGELRRNGLIYTIAVIDRDEEDGRLLIDARTGRIIRFVPAEELGGNIDEDSTVGDARTNASRPIAVRWPPRPPAPVPHVASRRPATAVPRQPATHATESKPLEANARAPASLSVAPVLPTQPMPQMQGLE
jgi:hypothetical protein